MNGRLVNALDRIAKLPGIHQLREARFNEAFVNGKAVGCCRGIFQSYAAAASAAPETRPLGYDHVDAAAMYHDRLERVYPSDYPMMLWLVDGPGLMNVDSPKPWASKRWIFR